MPHDSGPTTFVPAPPGWWWYDDNTKKSYPVAACAVDPDPTRRRMPPCYWDITGLWIADPTEDEAEDTRLVYGPTPDTAADQSLTVSA